MVLVMLVPLPAFVLDMLLAMSITASVVVFLSAVQLRRAVEFSVFPTLLLLLTLFRLSLNLASSRRILLHGYEGTQAAGQVIRGLRTVCRRRQLRCGLRALSGVDCDSIFGRQSRCRAHGRGDGTLYVGCFAGQADGD